MNEKECFSAKFNCEEGKDEIFSVTKGKHKVTVTFVRKSKAKKGKPKQHKKDMLLFENVETGVDLEYAAMANGVKENIIVKGKADEYRYAFDLLCENLEVQSLAQEKRVVFLDKENGEEVFFIPAPFMKDAKGTVSTEVFYEVSEIGKDEVRLTVTVDDNWINDEERAFPVAIDPQIFVSAASNTTTYSWKNGALISDTSHTIGMTAENSAYQANRMYMSIPMPVLTYDLCVKKVALYLSQSACTYESSNYPLIGIFEASENLSNVTASNHSEIPVDYDCVKTSGTYIFNITQLWEEALKNNKDSMNVLLKLIDENSENAGTISIYGEGNGTSSPRVYVTYDTSYEVNTSSRTHTHSLGCMGQGSVDLLYGNLMFEAEDFAWAGNRMPAKISHLYNSALSDYPYTSNSAIKLETADYSAIKLGYGWKLNTLESMVPTTGASGDLVYINGNGEERYFVEDEQEISDILLGNYKLYRDVSDSEAEYNPVLRIIDLGEESRIFDEGGRVIHFNDSHGNTMSTTSHMNIEDGIGRNFALSYDSNGFLTSITAPDGTKVSYTYTGNLLTGITYPSGAKAVIQYSSNKTSAVILQNADSENLYKVEYEFQNNQVHKVTEYGVDGTAFVKGTSYVFEYSAAANRTIVQTIEPMDASEGETEDCIVKTVYSFDAYGNVIGEYMYSEETGNVGAESNINPHSNDNGVVHNNNNLLLNHSFNTLSNWNNIEGNEETFQVINDEYEQITPYHRQEITLCSYVETCVGKGVYQQTAVLPEGEYTFSAYLRTVTEIYGAEDSGVYLQVTDSYGNVLSESEHLSNASDFRRLMVNFELSAAKSVKVCILTDGKGLASVNAPQLENNAYANTYNMLENGHFENGIAGWTANGASASTAAAFNMSNSLMISGDLQNIRNAYQDILVKRFINTRETFTLSGWAKGYGMVKRVRNNSSTPQFRLRAVIHYEDAAVAEETYTADFSPYTTEWQFASIQFEKSKYSRIEYVRVYCDYDYNWGTAYFDDLQLVRNSSEIVTEADFVEDTSTEDDSTEETTTAFEEAEDSCGNTLTETVFDDAETSTIYRSFGYSSNGNDLVRETDPRGYQTEYTVDSTTSRNTEVKDRCGNRTAYEYDGAGRTTKVTSKNASGTALANVSYAYDSFDNMTEIVRGDDLKYVLEYNAFHNLESIGINGKSEKLVSYTYKNGSGRLKQITYANGDVMKVTYNSLGQMNSERWYNAANTLMAHYKYVYDGEGNIIRSIDLLSKKEYDYTYEDGRIVRAVECNITVNSSEIVTSKSVVNEIVYRYDSEGRLTKKRILSASGTEQELIYTNAEDGSVSVSYTAGNFDVSSSSVTDAFGRKTSEALHIGMSDMVRQFTYHAGQVTAEHTAKNKVKGTPTTYLVSQLVLTDAAGTETRSLSYEYDAEERITKVIDSLGDTTEYTYDALGQLLTEKVNGTVVNSMTYDNYGNILTKNGVTYTYGDSVWKDKLTSYGGQAISYDAQGNPTTYLGHTLTWEKGRQLKSFDSNVYTYNANGIRTSKTVSSVKHTYTLDGVNILKETWGSNTLIPMYDNEESVCGIIYNDVPYCFKKNLQGDIIAITDENGLVVARYSYDAWGKCSIVEDTSGRSIASVNPYRYRGYYYDVETGLYYLQSRYYDPVVGRFINGDDVMLLGVSGNSLSYNLFAYCYNNPSNYIDSIGESPIQVVLSILFGVLGFVIADYIARRLGLSPRGKGKWNAARYWALTGAIAVGGAAIGWFAGTAITKAVVSYLSKNPANIIRIANKCGGTKFSMVMRFLGINPFNYVTNASQLTALARALNSSWFSLPKAWAQAFCNLANKLGRKLFFHTPHGRYGYHIHMGGRNGQKLEELHFQVIKSVWNFLKKRFG